MATYDEEVLADTPKGYWKLDETTITSGSTHADSSGNGKTMTLAGTGPFLAAKRLRKLLAAGSRYFNGIAQYAWRGYEAYFNVANVTMEIWAYCPNGTVGIAFSKVQTGGYQMLVGRSYIQTDIYIAGAYQTKGASFAVVDRPRHYVATFDGRYTKYYVDKELFFTFDRGSSANIQYGANVSLMIGANPNGTGSGYDVGSQPMAYYSNAAVYDHALAPERIAAHYDAARKWVSVTINESLIADNFEVTAVDTDGDLVGSMTTTAGNQLLEVDTALPVFVTVRPVVGSQWQAAAAYALDDKVFPSDPIAKPYYYKRLIAGTSGATEPVWPTTPGGQCDDGAVNNAWELVERLVQPVTHGPLIPA